jgi:hypothetical protein
MKLFRVWTTSSLETVPEKKAVFEGPMLDARKKARYRAVKYQGTSMIFAPENEQGHRLLVETWNRHAEVRR